MPTKRTYGDGCGMATALDVVGERWALIVVRELLLGPKRFTDLRAGMPGASPNVLAMRLRELEDSGVVRRRKLGPPVGAQVYELTAWGRDLEPVVLQLGRWAGGSPEPTAEPYRSADSLALWQRAAFDAAVEPGLSAVYAMRVGDDGFVVRVADGRLAVERGTAQQYDALLAADLDTMSAVLKGRYELAAAIQDEQLECAGDQDAVVRLIRSLSSAQLTAAADGH
jgi:DNA-binding HxlR family transcriptional regulator